MLDSKTNVNRDQAGADEQNAVPAAQARVLLLYQGSEKRAFAETEVR